MESNPRTDAFTRAFRKILAAIQGVGLRAAVIGPLARQAWGTKDDPDAIDLLIPEIGPSRDALAGAARGEGFQETPDPELIRYRYVDTRSGTAVDVRLQQASTPLLQQLHGRAQTAEVLQTGAPLAGCEDLILLLAASPDPAHHSAIVELLRCTAGRMDPAYLKAEAEKAGTFDRVKSAWQEAKRQQ